MVAIKNSNLKLNSFKEETTDEYIDQQVKEFEDQRTVRQQLIYKDKSLEQEEEGQQFIDDPFTNDQKPKLFKNDPLSNYQYEEQMQNICQGSTTTAKFSCAECGKRFTARNSLRMHITGIHLNQGELCNYCEKIVSFGNLKRHIKEKHQKVKKPCPECGREYGMSNLSHHIRAVHKRENKQCPAPGCGRFLSRSNISTHIKSSHADLKKVCDICNEELSYDLYSDHRLQRHNLTGKMASVLDDHNNVTMKSEINRGEEKRIKSLNVGNKMFTFTLE